VLIDNSGCFCNPPPGHDYVISDDNDVTITFVSKADGRDRKFGGMSIMVTANGMTGSSKI